MRYPAINAAKCQTITTSLAKGVTSDIAPDVVWRGIGESIDFSGLDTALAEMRIELGHLGTDPELTPDKEPFEAELAVAIYAFLSELPIEVLDDPDFWRFLAVSRFWWFIEWRESKPIESGHAATYTDARRNTEQIPLRLFLRVKSVATVSGPEFVLGLEKCTDFWRSHVIRVRNGAAPALATSLVAMQKSPARLKTEPLRAFARRLNRTWTNTHLALYDRAMAEALVSEFRP